MIKYHKAPLNTLHLPQELIPEPGADVALYYYHSDQNLSKQQIILHKNTFSFLRSGKKEVYFDHSSFAIDPDQFLLMKSGHCLMKESISEQSHNYISILLFFPTKVIHDFIKRHGIQRSTNDNPQSVFAFTYDDFIRRYVDSLQDIARLPESLRQVMLAPKLEEILIYLHNSQNENFILDLVEHSNDHDQHFSTTVESNILNRLTVKELAFLCRMSESTFKREFSKRYGISPIKWYQEKRLEHAYHLIKEQQMRPSDVYLEVGYENLSSFIQAYKSRFGRTPKQHALTV